MSLTKYDKTLYTVAHNTDVQMWKTLIFIILVQNMNFQKLKRPQKLSGSLRKQVIFDAMTYYLVGKKSDVEGK